MAHPGVPHDGEGAGSPGIADLCRVPESFFVLVAIFFAACQDREEFGVLECFLTVKLDTFCDSGNADVVGDEIWIEWSVIVQELIDCGLATYQYRQSRTKSGCRPGEGCRGGGEKIGSLKQGQLQCSQWMKGLRFHVPSPLFQKSSCRRALKGMYSIFSPLILPPMRPSFFCVAWARNQRAPRVFSIILRRISWL